MMLVSDRRKSRWARRTDKGHLVHRGSTPESPITDLHQGGRASRQPPSAQALPWTFRRCSRNPASSIRAAGRLNLVTRGSSHHDVEAQLATVVGPEIATSQLGTRAEYLQARGRQSGPGSAACEARRIASMSARSRALGVLFLKLSARAREQADELGVRYSRRAKYGLRRWST